jgi:hypothetical protein
MSKRKYRRLTPAEWAEARALWESGETVLQELSVRFGVTERALQAHFKKHSTLKGSKAKELAAADICERKLHPIPNLLVHFVRDTNPAGLGYRLQPRGNVNAVAVKALTLVDHVPDIHADPEQHRWIAVGVEVRHAALDGGGALHRPDGARELSEDAISGEVDHPAAEPLNNRQNGFTDFSELSNGTLFVRAHEDAVARNVSGQDRG